MNYSKKTDNKWLKYWQDNNIYKYDENNKGEKFYVLEMFSYPSGSKLHLGHWFNFAPLDSYSRFKRMQGYNVFHPMGFDSFGLPAENFAIANKTHPKDSTLNNIEIMKKQLIDMGSDYDWNYSLSTCDEDYYKWTQWLFIKLFEKGLAYKKEAPVNWCPSCQTVLANEQVKNGLCDRCDSAVSKRKISQWFFKITDYCEPLINDLEQLDWPESTKKVQLNWIGKSLGSTITFKVENSKEIIKVFTTRSDTLNGVTYLVLAPENELVKKLTTKKEEKNVLDYVNKTSFLSEIERMETKREKTGVFSGSYAVNPINDEVIPIWISDYVLESYGTGCVMAVPAHDVRDFEFANKFKLNIKQVIKNKSNNTLPMIEDGILINSGKYNNLNSIQAQENITNDLIKSNTGEFTTNYRLKDWLVSRQRYWGAPIPIIYCDKCGIVTEKEENLPVKLPYDVEFRPDGKSPLSKSKEFVNCKCPKCAGKATREVDTLDTFVCSSWYYLRYPDANNKLEAFNKKTVNKMLPVDLYVGGNEHAAMHLIYSRFITKALADMGYLDFNEPFIQLRHQGMILGSDGNKMSKSKGNTVSPDKYVNQYGADVFRVYIMFGFSYLEGGPWKDEGVAAISKYFSRIQNFLERIYTSTTKTHTNINNSEQQLLTVMNKSILGIENDLDKLQFNTAVAKTMEFMNELIKYEQSEEIINLDLLKDCAQTFVKVFAPLAPFFSEELWSYLGHKPSVHLQKWPTVDFDQLNKGKIEIAIQINGKLRGTLQINQDEEKESVINNAKKIENVIVHLENKKIKKIIYVPGKILNFVI